MKKIILISFSFLLTTLAWSQNVGIGTNSPLRAKLEVEGAAGSTNAIFGGESAGVSLQRNWPAIGFNEYYNAANRYMSNGFAAVQYLDPTAGYIAWDIIPAGTADAACAPSRRAMTLAREGNLFIGNASHTSTLTVGRNPGSIATASFAGTEHASVFNHGTNENTYIRAGKSNGSVFINDITGGKAVFSGLVGINTATPGYPLELRQKNSRGLLLVNETNFNNWELRVAIGAGQLQLLYNQSIKGSFNPSNGAYSSVSDGRLKTEVETLESVLPRVRSLGPVTYHFSFDKEPTVQQGFLAQDVKQLFPELVNTLPEPVNGFEKARNLNTLNYEGFGVIAVKALQEQQEQIDGQERSISELELKMERMEKNTEKRLVKTGIASNKQNIK